jgi:hypothetical protein
MLRHLNAFRLATGLLVLFDLGHTLGGGVLHRSSGPAEDTVLAAMRTPLVFGGHQTSYEGFHTGYGWITTILLTLSAYLTWQLGKPGGFDRLRPVAWALFISYLGVAYLSFRYFFAGPGALAAGVALLCGVRCLRARSSQPAAHGPQRA